jgi:hypothetical protein
LISAEWCTFTNDPWGRGPINFEPQEEGRAMEVYATWAKMFELQKYYSWIVDRFHISTQAHQKQTYGKLRADSTFLTQKSSKVPTGKC